MKSVEIEIAPGCVVGGDAPCFVLAEVGINHNGDRALAEELIAAAAGAGADGIKFQNYRTEDFVSDRNQSYTYVSQGGEVTESMFEMFKRYEIDRDFVEHLKAGCDQHKIMFTSTPTSREGIEDLLAVGTTFLKNGSDFLTNPDLVRRMGETGLPTILSCGMANLSDIDDAVRTFYETGNDQLVLLHCTSSYPTPPGDVHLQKIETLRTAFSVPVGLSDHTDGTVAGCVASAMGACMIEKHFTLDRGLPGPDHRFSCEPDELRALVAGVRSARSMVGESAVGPTDNEKSGRSEYRLSCVAERKLTAGHMLRKDDVSFKRPGDGIPPAALRYLVGRRLKANIPPNGRLNLSDFE